MGLKDQASLPQHGDRGHVDGECGCEILLLDVGPSAAKEIESLLGPKGYSFRVYSSLEKLLEMGRSDGPSCLILGCGADGGEPRIEVLDEFRKRSWNLPVVVIAKQWDIDLVVNSLRAGADGFVPWPFDSAKFLDSICHALKYERHLGYNGMSVCESRSLLASLHSRELEVVRCVVDGLLNKEIADRMDLAVVTVKIYRARAMKKLGAGNAAELAKVVVLGGLDTKIDAPEHS